MFLLIWFCLFVLPSVGFSDGREYSKPVHSFSFDGAKKRLYRDIPFVDELYCGCPWSKGKIDFKNCAFRPDRKSIRANRVEAEHMVPAAEFGRRFKEYKLGDKKCRTPKGVLYSGRQCLLKISAEYRQIHNDLHNLRPSVGLVNGDRSDIPYGELPETKNRYTGCDFKWTKLKVEPRDAVKGDIARNYFYMSNTYPKRIILDSHFLQMLESWSNRDPVDEEECKIDDAIFKVQGNHNPFIWDHCK